MMTVLLVTLYNVYDEGSPVTQWAAVRTCLGPTREPPHLYSTDPASSVPT